MLQSHGSLTSPVGVLVCYVDHMCVNGQTSLYLLIPDKFLLTFNSHKDTVTQTTGLVVICNMICWYM